MRYMSTEQTAHSKISIVNCPRGARRWMLEDGEESVWYAVTPFHFCFSWPAFQNVNWLQVKSEFETGRMHWVAISRRCARWRVALFSFAQDYHCSCHLHSPPTILILIVVVVVANVIVITAVISLDPSLLVAMVAPGVSPTVWANQVSALTNIYTAATMSRNFSMVANLNQCAVSTQY